MFGKEFLIYSVLRKEGSKVGGSFFLQVLEVIVMIKTFHRRGHGFLRTSVQSVK